MSDIRFACPRCQQHIQAEPAYVGIEIACPSCSAKMVVPGQPVMQMSAPAPVPVPVSAAPPSSAAGGCPACGAPLARGTVLCTKCGYNLVTKQRLGTGQVAAAKRGKATSGEEKWYKTPYPYLGMVLLIFGLLYYLGTKNPFAMLGFLAILGFYALATHIWVTVIAFKEGGVGTGFLALCVPIYALRWVFKEHESAWVKSFYSLAYLILVALRILRRIHYSPD